MIALGIEGTAHTCGVGIVDDSGNILANEIDMYRPATGGIHPREAANHHAEKLVPMVKVAVEKAGITFKDIDIVTFSQGPGLGPCLRTVATGARALALTLDVPIVGVNHCIAHLEIGRIKTAAKDPVLLYASGGNTQVIAFANGRYRIFGETLDIGIGNMLDKMGREIGLGYYAGPKIEKTALGGKKLLDLPYSVKGMDMAFSGILTAALCQKAKGETLEDICFSVQETTFAMLTEVTERAMAHVEKSEVLLGGGVVQNKRLQEMVGLMANERGAKMFVPDRTLCMDNGAMIAWTGLIMYQGGVRMRVNDTMINQRFRTDEVEVSWRD
ncbi:MAG: bifunctional N(6)-L-threonylcarbamoyladenine synthase/serine/threonine protein kinase [Methanomassiliicoccales archaeon]|jgi:N6-L-threonylcarbamoyladenine synthase/N6-L-threonylcarbamoyladenine synthase/protein kinase Bud32